MPVLAEMFPKHKFILVDPSPFHIREDVIDKKEKEKRIEIINDYFTDDLA